MDQKYQDIIRSNMTKLSQLVDLPLVVPFLIHKNIFTESHMDTVLAHKTDAQRKIHLLTDLCSCANEAFDHFVQILIETGHHQAAQTLNPKIKLSRLISSSYLVDDQLDTRTQLRVARSEEWMSNQDTYKMESQPRGYCLLVNNVNFDLDSLDTRIGSDSDAWHLKEVFVELGFQVIYKTDLAAHEMAEVCQDVAQRQDLDTHDALVVAILTHGNRGVLYGTNGAALHIETLLSIFDNVNCPALLHKPKLFFLQSCRGDQLDSGVTSVSTDAIRSLGINSGDNYFVPPYTPPRSRSASVSTLEDGGSPSKVPRVTDMLISYSTLDGFVSMRNPEYGSWYATALYYTLVEYACNTDLIKLLQKVDQLVQRHESHDGLKQATEVKLRGFTKSLYFNPGLYKT